MDKIPATVKPPQFVYTYRRGEKKRETRHPRFFFPLLRIEVLLFKNWNRIFKTRLPPSILSLPRSRRVFIYGKIDLSRSGLSPSAGGIGICSSSGWCGASAGPSGSSGSACPGPPGC